VPIFSSVLCAVQDGDLALPVIRHAAGIAGATGARLTLLMVTGGAPGEAGRLEELYDEAVPYGATYLKDVRFRAEAGTPLDVILDANADADLLVVGTHGRSGLSRMFLGSTSTPLLERTTQPMLLVPPTDLDIVTLDFTTVGLNFGGVLAAVDLNEQNHAELAMAAEMAALSKRKWMCLTVADSSVTDHDAAAQLRAKAKGLAPHPHSFIVRRGDVPEEIARCAVAEQAGLVVMGLRQTGRGHPGKVATAVAATGRAIVLAIPG
jgi:nucleotide-binding universal stress UspA family protein